MLKRPIDVILASVALVFTAPLMAVAAIGIRLSSPGPIFYCASRVGINGRLFVMYKFRTMHVRTVVRSVVTAQEDSRVFPFGRLLRRTKIDELPQLLNILKNEMSIVGPRPEDPSFVKRYAPEHLQTLSVLPGLASPGSIYNCTHGEMLIDSADPEQDYVNRLLPTKLALEAVYVRQASVFYDLRLMFRALWVIIGRALGRRHFPEPPEMKMASYLTRSALSAQQST